MIVPVPGTLPKHHHFSVYLCVHTKDLFIPSESGNESDKHPIIRKKNKWQMFAFVFALARSEQDFTEIETDT